MKQTLFEGNGQKAEFAKVAYQLLMKREWVTYEDIMEARLKKPLDIPVTKCTDPPYSELKKAFPALCELLCQELGAKVIEESGNNRHKRYRYVGVPADPLEDLVMARRQDLETYYQFCQDAASILPMAWMEYFLEASIDLRDIKRSRDKGERIMATSADRELKNLELLPEFYEAIQKNKVLSLEYKTHPLIFHPQFIKEFNDRWYVFGVKEGESEVSMLALDRITQPPQRVPKAVYRPAEKGFYLQYFDSIVGVTSHPHPAEKVCLRAYTAYMFDLVDSKPLHHSQRVTLLFGDEEGKAYGEFELMVKTNLELIARILQYGSELEVVAPAKLRASLAKRVRKMAQLYEEVGE